MDMGYESDKIEVKGAKEGYESLGEGYAQYHGWLSDFDRAEWRRFLPRQMSDVAILDLGAGDGRTYEWFADSGYSRYVACDVSPSLLALHPGDDVEKQEADLEENLPFGDESFDVVTSFFVLEHVEHLKELFREVRRVLQSGGRWIFTLFPQRREFVHGVGKQKFKIVTHPYGFDIVEQLAHDIDFDVHVLDLLDHRKRVVGKAYCLMKD